MKKQAAFELSLAKQQIVYMKTEIQSLIIHRRITEQALEYIDANIDLKAKKIRRLQKRIKAAK